MGYKHMTDPNQGFASGNAASSYNINNLASRSQSTPSGMREDILLASWLIVLLRTREGERVSFDWTYQNSSDAPEQTSRLISMEDVMNGLGDSIGNVTKTISSQISRSDSGENYSEAASLLLSTSVLSQQSEDSTVRSSSTCCNRGSQLTC